MSVLTLSDEQITIACNDFLRAIALTEFMTGAQQAALRERLNAAGFEPDVLTKMQDLIDAIVYATHEPHCPAPDGFGCRCGE